jgi:quercetin dioxygenase-like cupin family protein
MNMPETTHTPTGQYPQPQPVHHLDLEVEADRLLTELANHELQSQNVAREGGVSLVMMAMEAGEAVREHSTPGATSIQVIRGHTTLEANGQSISLRPGEVLLFEPGLRHNISAEEQSVVLLTITGGEK